MDTHENNLPYQKTSKWNIIHWSHIDHERVKASRRKVYTFNVIPTGLNFLTEKPRNQTAVA